MIEQLKKLTAVFFVLILFYSCFPEKDCGSITCPGVPDNYNNWMPYHYKDTLRYVNALNNEITFIENYSYISKTQKIEYDLILINLFHYLLRFNS